jgi:hypothetical protein
MNLPDSLDSILYLEDMPRCVCEKGGNLRSIKIWVKRRKIVVSAPLLFYTALKFFTLGEGGIGGPNTPYGALGSPGKYSQNLFYQN